MKRPARVRIRRLVLRGFGAAEAERVAEALRSGLERRLAGASPAVAPGDAGAAAAETIMQRLSGVDAPKHGGGT